MQRIPDDSSIFTAEAKAVDLALDFISTCDANNKFIIFSDSRSVLKAMNHTSSKNPQIQKLLENCHELLAYCYVHPLYIYFLPWHLLCFLSCLPVIYIYTYIETLIVWCIYI